MWWEINIKTKQIGKKGILTALEIKKKEQGREEKRREELPVAEASEAVGRFHFFQGRSLKRPRTPDSFSRRWEEEHAVNVKALNQLE